MPKPPVWFERPLLPQVVEHVTSTVEVLIPESLQADPYQHLESAVGAVLGSLPLDGRNMDHAPGLFVVARTGIGYDQVDIDAATQRGIAVCNAPDGPTVSTAEHAVTLALSIAKSVRISSDRLAAGESDLYARHRSIEFDGKTIGLIGCGRIARRVAVIAAGFGMRVVAYDPFVTDPPPPIELGDSLSEVLAAADVVSVHVPLNTDTARMCDDGFFSQMKPGSVFVNTARGGVVDQNALLRAIDEGHLFGAGLDVTDPEPLPADHPLVHHPAITITPHVAAGTNEAKLGNFVGAFEGVLSVLNRDRPQNLVNPDVWDILRSRIEAPA